MLSQRRTAIKSRVCGIKRSQEKKNLGLGFWDKQQCLSLSRWNRHSHVVCALVSNYEHKNNIQKEESKAFKMSEH